MQSCLTLKLFPLGLAQLYHEKTKTVTKENFAVGIFTVESMR